MIGGFFEKGHGLGVASSGSYNFISKHKVLFERKFSVLLNILLFGKKLKFVKVGSGSRLGLRKCSFSEGVKVTVHLMGESS